MGLHPTQLYELIFNLIIFGVLLKLRGLKPDGSLALIYLISYSAWRLGIGFVRDGTPSIANLQQAQVLGIIVLAITIPLLIRDRRNWAKAPSTAEEKKPPVPGVRQEKLDKGDELEKAG